MHTFGYMNIKVKDGRLWHKLQAINMEKYGLPGNPFLMSESSLNWTREGEWSCDSLCGFIYEAADILGSEGAIFAYLIDNGSEMEGECFLYAGTQNPKNGEPLIYDKYFGNKAAWRFRDADNQNAQIVETIFRVKEIPDEIKSSLASF